MRHQRPAVLTAAIAICVVNSLGNIATLASPVPRPIAYASIVLALIGVIGALGLWRLQHWGALLSSAVLALTAMLAAPGIVFAPIPMLHLIQHRPYGKLHVNLTQIRAAIETIVCWPRLSLSVCQSQRPPDRGYSTLPDPTRRYPCG